jgi:hypothetical protein
MRPPTTYKGKVGDSSPLNKRLKKGWNLSTIAGGSMGCVSVQVSVVVVTLLYFGLLL